MPHSIKDIEELERFFTSAKVPEGELILPSGIIGRGHDYVQSRLRLIRVNAASKYNEGYYRQLCEVREVLRNS